MPVKKLFLPPRGSFGWAKTLLAKHGQLAADEITLLVRRNFASDEIKAIIEGLAPKGKPGRRSTRTPAQLDFNKHFQALLAEIPGSLDPFQATRRKQRSEARALGGYLSKADLSPSDERWKHLSEKYRPKLKMGRRNLRNVVLRYRRAAAKWEPPSD